MCGPPRFLFSRRIQLAACFVLPESALHCNCKWPSQSTPSFLDCSIQHISSPWVESIQKAISTHTTRVVWRLCRNETVNLGGQDWTAFYEKRRILLWSKKKKQNNVQWIRSLGWARLVLERPQWSWCTTYIVQTRQIKCCLKMPEKWPRSTSRKRTSWRQPTGRQSTEGWLDYTLNLKTETVYVKTGYFCCENISMLPPT